MNPTEYTEAQKKDINERVEKARKFLADLELNLQASITAANTGGDVFGIKVVPYFQDLKYTPKLSPIQP